MRMDFLLLKSEGPIEVYGNIYAFPGTATVTGLVLLLLYIAFQKWGDKHTRRIGLVMGAGITISVIVLNVVFLNLFSFFLIGMILSAVVFLLACHGINKLLKYNHKSIPALFAFYALLTLFILHDVIIPPILFRHACLTEGGVRGQPILSGVGIFVEEEPRKVRYYFSEECSYRCAMLLNFGAEFVESKSVPWRNPNQLIDYDDDPVYRDQDYDGYYRFELDKNAVEFCGHPPYKEVFDKTKKKYFKYCVLGKKIEKLNSTFIYKNEIGNNNPFFDDFYFTHESLISRSTGNPQISSTGFTLNRGWFERAVAKLMWIDNPTAGTCYSSTIFDLFEDSMSMETH